MKKLKICLLLLITVMSSEIFAQALTADQKKQRIVASYRIAIGRQPVQGEIDHWLKQADLSVQQLVDYHMQYATTEATFKKEIIERSYRHGLGRNPSTTAPAGQKDSEVSWWMKQINQTYQQMMKNHVNYLEQNKNTAAYVDVINAAYIKIYGRGASGTEQSNWQGKPATSYAMMVSALKDHATKGGRAVLGEITNMSNTFMSAFPITDNTTFQQITGILGNTPAGKVLAEGTGSITSTIGAILPFFKL